MPFKAAGGAEALLEGRIDMDRQGRPPASDVEVWLAQELAFLYGVERKIRRRAALARRGLWIVLSVLTAAVGTSVLIYALTA